MSDRPQSPAEGAARPTPVALVEGIREAASVIVLRRDMGPAPRVLMGRRGARAAFMASKMVFPGGALDTADLEAAATLAVPERLTRLLGARPAGMAAPAADPALGAGLALAALRELAEETGLAPRPPAPGPGTGTGTGTDPGTGDGTGSATARPLPPAWARHVDRHGAPTAEGLDMVFRAVTPPGRPRRFDARFVTLDAACLAEPDDFSGADGELADLSWLTLEEAAAEDLPFVTTLVLAEIAVRLENPDPARPIPFFHHDGTRSMLDPLLTPGDGVADIP
ncbi:MAG: DNA mismatch repair protein MutT [Pseudomonadota bacterium]